MIGVKMTATHTETNKNTRGAQSHRKNTEKGGGKPPPHDK